MMKQDMGIDIIVPVYNALEDLKLCMESVIKHTDLAVNRVVLIDDKSPDKNVYPYLKSLEQPGIVVLQNAQNEGFSGTVNKGLQYSDRDVLLLNTDTVVTARWIQKITACAYSDDAIGTVTPFSNNATLCSIPNFCQENTVPYGLSIDAYGEVIEHASMRKYPRITVAVGFCMFIKREVIEKVGLFDKETFQKGYGEENDFCWRAEQLGYYHVLCDDTYVYHSGTASFVSDEKKKLIAEHQQILQTRYPEQNRKNSEYVRDNPHEYLRTNVDIYAKLANGKRNILYILHADFRADAGNNTGGTQFHVKDLVSHNRNESNIFVLARDEEVLRLTAYFGKEQMSFSFYVGKMDTFQIFHNRQIEQVMRQILAAFSIDLVHVHHVFGLSFDVFSVTKELGIPLILTMHDYYYICPSIKLLENGSVYCDATSENCNDCLHNQLGYAPQITYLPLWREKCLAVLNACDRLIVPSQAAKTVYAKVYPAIEDKITVITHGMDAFAAKDPVFGKKQTAGFSYRVESAFNGDYTIQGWAVQEGVDSRRSEIFASVQDKDGNCFEYQGLPVYRADKAKEAEQNAYCGFKIQIPDCYFTSGDLQIQLIIRADSEEFCGEITTVRGYVKREKKRRRIAFLGGLNQAKGSKIACQIIKQGANQYDWYLIGGVGDPELHALEKNNVFKTDWYKRENVAAILQQNQIDVVCILSIWPETFSYTLSEAQLAGVPVLATDVGALGERIKHEQTGCAVSLTASAKEIVDTLDALVSDEAAFAALREKVGAFRHKTIARMCAEYADLYRLFPLPEKGVQNFDPQAVYHAYAMCQMNTAGSGGVSDMELIRRVNELEAQLRDINQSLEYRMARFFNREKFPFKRQIKALIGFAYKVYVKFFR